MRNLVCGHAFASRWYRSGIDRTHDVSIKNRSSTDIGRNFGGNASKLGRECTQHRSEQNDSSCY
jgi:hypothetical protein